MRKIYVHTDLGSVSPVNPTLESDPYRSLSGAILNEASVTEKLMIMYSGSRDDDEDVTKLDALQTSHLVIIGDNNTGKYDPHKVTLIGVFHDEKVPLVDVFNLQFGVPTGGTGARINIYIHGKSAGSVSNYVNCIEVAMGPLGTYSDIRGFFQNSANATTNLINSVIANLNTAASSTGVRNNNGVFNVYNSVVTGTGTGLRGVNAVNCATFNNTKNFLGGSQTNCASDEAAGVNAVTPTLPWAIQFMDVPGLNFALSANSELTEKGTALPAGDVFLKDMIGANRDMGLTPDIGPIERFSLPYPDKPAGIELIVTTGGLAINWTLVKTVETSIEVQRKALTDPTFTSLVTLPAGSTSFTDVLPLENQYALYRVVPKNGADISVPSDAAMYAPMYFVDAEPTGPIPLDGKDYITMRSYYQRRSVGNNLSLADPAFPAGVCFSDHPKFTFTDAGQIIDKGFVYSSFIKDREFTLATNAIGSTLHKVKLYILAKTWGADGELVVCTKDTAVKLQITQGSWHYKEVTVLVSTKSEITVKPLNNVGGNSTFGVAAFVHDSTLP